MWLLSVYGFGLIPYLQLSLYLVQRKLELESRLEEEMMKIESAKTDLEKEKVALTTKLKQVGEHSELKYNVLYIHCSC